MANVQHIYSGISNPNYKSELQLQGDAVGVHLYMDTQTGNVWMSTFYIDQGVKNHDGWQMVTFTNPIE